MKNADLSNLVGQLREEIQLISQQTYGKKNGERFRSVQKLNQLRNLLSTIEEIDDSVDELLAEQNQKRNHTS